MNFYNRRHDKYCLLTLVCLVFKEQFLERVKGIEPSSSAWKAEVLPLNYTRIYNYEISNGREDRIRTCDPLVPNQVLYQAELLPDSKVIKL
jgi:hypothetical protein